MYSAIARGRGRDAGAVPAVLLPRRHPQPRRPGDARLDPRGRRARLRPGARLRRGVRQPRPARRCAWSATARPRPGRWRPAGTPTSSSTRSPTARCCRSCTSTATRSPTRPCSPGSPRTSCSTLMRGYGYAAVLRRAVTTRPTVHQQLAATLDSVARRGSPQIQHASPNRRARVADARPAALADDRAAHAEGLDRPEGGRRPAGRGHLPRPPGAAGRRPGRTPSTARSSRSGCAATGPRSCSTPPAGWCPSCAALAPAGRAADERQPARQRRPAAARPGACPTSAHYAVEVTEPGDRTQRGDQGAGRVPARHRRWPTATNFRIMGPGRDRLQPAAGGVRADRPGLGRRGACTATCTWPPTAG